jgi:hypothetical protein
VKPDISVPGVVVLMMTSQYKTGIYFFADTLKVICSLKVKQQTRFATVLLKNGFTVN